jgi:hypothetical protein
LTFEAVRQQTLPGYVHGFVASSQRSRRFLIHGDLLGHTVQADGLFEKSSGGCVISLGAKNRTV